MGASLDASCVLQYGYCVNVPVVVDHEGNDRAVAINIHIAEDDRDVLWCFDAMRKMMPGWAAINTLVIADESEPVILSPCSSDHGKRCFCLLECVRQLRSCALIGVWPHAQSSPSRS